LRIDIPFGCALEPVPKNWSIPACSISQQPGYGLMRASVTAKKFQMMVSLRRADTRMKDFYKIWIGRSISAMPDRRE
jgi:hypothetical protein